MQKTREYQTLLYACTQEGCPICRLAQESANRYLDAWKYELFTDVEVRQMLRRSLGFCHAHTWQLAHMGATLQLAQAYRDIITDTSEQLQSGTDAPTASSGLFRRIFDTGSPSNKREPCPACYQKEQAEIRQINTLRKVLLDEDFYRQFAASDGLCLEHFRLSSELKMSDTPGDWLALLRQAQLGCLKRLDEQLGEMIRKHDYHFKDEARGPEMISWKRAAGIVSGEENNP